MSSPGAGRGESVSPAFDQREGGRCHRTLPQAYSLGHIGTGTAGHRWRVLRGGVAGPRWRLARRSSGCAAGRSVDGLHGPREVGAGWLVELGARRVPQCRATLRVMAAPNTRPDGGESGTNRWPGWFGCPGSVFPPGSESTGTEAIPSGNVPSVLPSVGSGDGWPDGRGVVAIRPIRRDGVEVRSTVQKALGGVDRPIRFPGTIDPRVPRSATVPACTRTTAPPRISCWASFPSQYPRALCRAVVVGSDSHTAGRDWEGQ